jgi:signal transduction histidine kinase
VTRGMAPRSIRSQIFLLATVPIIVLAFVTSGLWLMVNVNESRSAWASRLTGRAEMVADQLRLAGDASVENAVLQASAGAGITAEIVSAQETARSGNGSAAATDAGRLLAAHMSSTADRSIRSIAIDGRPADVLILRLDAARALALRIPEAPAASWLTRAAMQGLMVILAIMLLALVIVFYASRRITAPLDRFVADAERISLDETTAELFHAAGASEIQSLAASLNTLRGRILGMFEDRTQMLRAVSHDLRTPLTRLRMRVERSQEPELRRSMLADITTLTTMTDECLTFLNKVPASEQPRKVDLTSLLQTVVADFSDVGVPVTFSGPRRLACVCQPQAITRAVSNIIDNASRFAATIEVALQEAEDGGAVVTISDDGPGLSEALKRRALEPFFKADEARRVGRGGGFGLGLPIAKGIIQHHQGSLNLLDRTPNGLIVEIQLPANSLPGKTK